MSLKYDATLKKMVELYPEAILRLAGLPTGEITIEDTDLSTVTAMADKVIRVTSPDGSYIVHTEFESGYKNNHALGVKRYNGMLEYDHNIPVRSVSLLLHPKADGPGMTGIIDRVEADGHRLYFEYKVIRLWKLDVDMLLNAHIGLLPLAPLANITKDQVSGIIHRMEDRVRTEVAPSDRGELWTSTYVLMGLKYSQSFIADVLQGVNGMEESVTYMSILNKGEARGEVKEARNLLLQLGSLRLGEPSEGVVAAVANTAELDKLEMLLRTMMKVESWDELPL